MNYEINIRKKPWKITKPQVMGILNCTPDSFFSDSRKQTEKEIAEQACRIVSEGGTIIDVGGMSTRPGIYKYIGGLDFVDEVEEMRRLRNALTIVRRECPETVVSVDTFRPSVARMSVEEFGADIINDVSEGGVTTLEGVEYTEQGNIFQEVARLGVPYILMSVKPTLAATLQTFREKTEILRAYGVKDIILDPGYGFGKSIEQNYSILSSQQAIVELFPDMPLLAGVSRKRMIWQFLGTTPGEALNGTTAVNLLALLNGASILRVHDVREAVETVKIFMQVRNM